mmetsp:Transcript_37694/g.108389  ORF Transcript_37694/g.108389 Transcript_37694/m.108389 type:complete len:213 (-) Transcript_37694:735-1373(-)
MAIGADERRVGMHRRHDARGPELLQDMREALGIAQAHADIEQAIDQHLVGNDFLALDHRDGPVDVRRGRVVLKALHQDRACERIGAHAGALHGLDDGPSAIGVLARHRVTNQRVIGHRVRGQASARHLPKDRARLGVRARGQEHLQVGVVGNDVDLRVGRHAPEEVLGGGTVVAHGACLQRTIVRSGVDRDRRALELLEETQRFWQVPFAAR